MAYNILILLHVFAAASALVILIVSIYVRRADKSLFFIYLMLSIFILDFAFLFEITAPTFEAAFRSTQGQYLGGPFTAPLHLLFILDYCGVKRKWYQTALLFIIPVISFLLVLTWPLNRIYYKDIVFVTDSVLPHLKVTGSMFYYTSFVYILMTSVASIAVIMYHFFKRDAMFKKQSIIFMLAATIPCIGIAFNAFGPFDIDATPILSGVTCLLFGYNFLKLGFYRITPIARDQIVENMSDGFVLLDMNNCFIEANSKAKRIFPQLTLTSPGTKVHDIAGIFRPNAKGSVSKNEFITVKHKDSQKHYQLSQTNIMSGNRIIARCVMIYDATETKRLLDDVSALAERDTLTGLSNRRTLYQRWENLYPHLIIYDSLCLLMLDVDFFKRVNDIHGHLKGDEVLKTIAEQLSSRFRKSDTVARYGGEEFCILLPDVQLKTAITLIRGLKDDIAKHTYHSSRGDFTVTISIGVTSFDRSRHSSLNAMIADADAALYAAKNSGRNTIYFARSTCEKVSSDADDLVLECVLNTFPAGIDDV